MTQRLHVLQWCARVGLMHSQALQYLRRGFQARSGSSIRGTTSASVAVLRVTVPGSVPPAFA